MDTEGRILNILKKANKPLSKSEIARRIKVTTATASKYVEILAAKGEVKITNYGNIHLIELGGKDGG